MLEIYILAKDIESYHKGAAEMLPGMSRYHQAVFKKEGDDYVGEKHIIKPCISAYTIFNKTNYQLVKFGDFTENKDAEEIERLYDEEVKRRERVRRNNG